MNDDQTTTPELFESDVLPSSMQINGVDGKGGDLVITSEIENAADITDEGVLTVKVINDDANKYSNDATNGNLTYNNG